ncbi:MAG: diguanylate cyclase [Sedimenticola sp.]
MENPLQPNKQALEHCPLAVMVLDGTGKVRWANSAFEAISGLDSAQLIGKDRESPDDTTLKTLLTSNGPIHLVNGDEGSERVLQCTTVQGEDGEQIKYFQEITEVTQLREQNRDLQQQVAELAITDELTGLANPRALSRALNAQVTRSRRYGNPLSLIIAELSDDNAPGEQLPDGIILAVSRHLRYRLRWADTIARWSDSQFVIILPETGQEECRKLIEKIERGFSEIPLPEEEVERNLQLQFGNAQWQKGDDAKKLLRKAGQDLFPEEGLTANTA